MNLKAGHILQSQVINLSVMLYVETVEKYIPINNHTKNIPVAGP
jgi:hypothetical protein